MDLRYPLSPVLTAPSSPADIQEIAGHKLSDAILERLPTLCTMNPGRKISYSEVIAFHNIIREMDAVERIILHAVRKSRDGRIDLSDFLNEAAGSMRYGMFTPMEVSQRIRMFRPRAHPRQISFGTLPAGVEWVLINDWA